MGSGNIGHLGADGLRQCAQGDHGAAVNGLSRHRKGLGSAVDGIGFRVQGKHHGIGRGLYGGLLLGLVPGHVGAQIFGDRTHGHQGGAVAGKGGNRQLHLLAVNLQADGHIGGKGGRQNTHQQKHCQRQAGKAFKQFHS
ncbi:hypothetical protein SDC9_134874 [bioreactor metagenome]|uniref:Uncharacterized protein n=1 Tax=bioreactor metagenome TaxID=1076179 RepID=A0A645DEC0_9ZZZZ